MLGNVTENGGEDQIVKGASKRNKCCGQFPEGNDRVLCGWPWTCGSLPTSAYGMLGLQGFATVMMTEDSTPDDMVADCVLFESSVRPPGKRPEIGSGLPVFQAEVTEVRVKERAQRTERRERSSKLFATLSLIAEHEGERKELRKTLFSFSNSHISYCWDEKSTERALAQNTNASHFAEEETENCRITVT